MNNHKMIRESKTISFSELEKISKTNYGELNRSINTDELVNDFPELETQYLIIEKLIEHHHSFGKPIGVHFRCGVTVPNVPQTLFQDMTIEQWESIGRNETVSHSNDTNHQFTPFSKRIVVQS